MVRVHHRDSQQAQVCRAARADDQELVGAEHAGSAKLRRYLWHANDAALGVGRGEHEWQRASQVLVVKVRDQDNIRVGRDHLVFELAAEPGGHHGVVQVRVDVDDIVAISALDAHAVPGLAEPLDHVCR